MKAAVALLISGFAAQQASATWNRGANFYKSPQYNNNECSDKQKGGFNWSDLKDGDKDFEYGDFDFKQGWSCSNSFGKRDHITKRTFGSKCIKNKVRKEKPAKFGCDKRKEGFSIVDVDISVEYDVDLEFHYKMPDGSTCKQVSPCKKEGTTVKNTQCGGAREVEVYIGKHWEHKEKKEDCEIGFHNINFDCNPEKPYNPPSPPEQPPKTSSGYVPEQPPKTTGKCEGPDCPQPPQTTGGYVPEQPPQSSTQQPPQSSSGYVPEQPPQSSTQQPPQSSSGYVPEQPPQTTGKCEGPDCPQPPQTTGGYVPEQPPQTTGKCEGPDCPQPPQTTGGYVPEQPPQSSTQQPPQSSSGYVPEQPPQTTATGCQGGYGGYGACPSGQPPYPPPYNNGTHPPPPCQGDKCNPAQPCEGDKCNPAQPCEGDKCNPAQPCEGDKCNPAPPTETPENPSTPPTGANPPECLPRCMNTWIQINTQCKDNTDAQCYCKNPDFTKSVIDCVAAWSDDDKTSEALSYLLGICAEQIPENPGIVTDCPTYIPLNPPTPTPAPGNPPNQDVPKTTITYGSTSITVPQIHFYTPTAPAGGPGPNPTEPVVLVPGTTPPAAPAVPTAPYPIPGTMSTTVIGPTGTGSYNGTAPPEFTGAASPINVEFKHAILGAALAFFAL